jgi:hypothetical protein
MNYYFARDEYRAATFFAQNKSRWTMLPGGRDRVRIEALLKYPDWLLKLRYRWFARFWEKERGWEYVKVQRCFPRSRCT